MVPNSHTHMNDILGNPGKSGHLCNQDTFGGPKGVRITQGPLYIHTYVRTNADHGLYILRFTYVTNTHTAHWNTCPAMTTDTSQC